MSSKNLLSSPEEQKFSGLPDFVWWRMRNQQMTESGMDCLLYCADVDHFQTFPIEVVYDYNSRGFRDSEWPNTVAQLQQAVWCFGDSFTIGTGSPREHTWTYLLENKLNQRCINVSMNAQSNEWMARKVQQLVTEVIPQTIIVHWSYTHRRELKNLTMSDLINVHWKKFYNNIRHPGWPAELKFEDFHTLPNDIQKEIKERYYDPKNNRFNFDKNYEGMYDEDRILYAVKSPVEQDTQNIIECINSVEQIAHKHQINLIHSFIPNFAPCDQIPTVENHLLESGTNFVPIFNKLDLARDGHHYDIKTASHFVNQLTHLI
jgi:hypothetical protein